MWGDVLQKILVIKLSALGDFILALPAMAAIRQKHPKAHITLLTTKNFSDLAAKSGYFNDIILDDRKPLYDLGYVFGMARKLNRPRFDFVYDLQLNKRSAAYFRLMRKKPGWSGVTRGASMRYPNKKWRDMHAYDRHKDMLKMAGIEVQVPDLSWMRTDVSGFELQKPYALLIPGSSPQHPQKRWPHMKYLSVAARLMREGYDVAVLGGRAEQDVIEKIVRLSPRIRDLSGRTTLFDLATLAQDAALTVGNDTGPTHLAAMCGCPTIALFSGVSDPAKSAPVGQKVTVIQSDPIDGITVDDVMKVIDA